MNRGLVPTAECVIRGMVIHDPLAKGPIVGMTHFLFGCAAGFPGAFAVEGLPNLTRRHSCL